MLDGMRSAWVLTPNPKRAALANFGSVSGDEFFRPRGEGLSAASIPISRISISSCLKHGIFPVECILVS